MKSEGNRMGKLSGGSSPNQSIEAYQTLIIAHRDAAHRMGLSVLRRWGIRLDRDEALALFDIALCEAAATYKPARGASLLTWFFYNLKTELRRFLEAEMKPTALGGGAVSPHEGESSPEHPAAPLQLESPETSPEEQTYQRELRTLCREALGRCSPLEREVVLECYVQGEKVARVARRLGYSRGHLSLVKRNATRRFRGAIAESNSSIIQELCPKRAA